MSNQPQMPPTAQTPFRSLFQKQDNRRQVLESLLIALSFTSPLEPKHIKSIFSGFVYNKRFYISDQKKRRYLKKKDDLLSLTTKAKRRIHSHPIELIANRSGGDKKIGHEVALVRSLFLILLHLDFRDIKQIKKQKRNHSPYTPDLTIITESDTLLIEVDTGSQPIKTLETKIKGYQAVDKVTTLIYFTNSARTYSHFTQNQSVQFIHLQSPTLSEDLQKLTTKNPKMWATKPPILSSKDTKILISQGNVHLKPEIVRASALKLLHEDE